MIKRIITAFVIAFTMMNVSAQTIMTDDIVNVAGRDVRMISASSETFRSFADKVVLSLNLMASQPVGEQDITYTLYVSLRSMTPLSAPSSARMLMRTKKQDVIMLEEATNKPKEDSMGELEMVGGSPYKMFTLGLLYDLTPEEIAQISEGVIKIRIETNGEKPYEKEWKKDKIGTFIKKEYDLLSAVLANTPDKRASFEVGF